jgi:hypothetical protein
MAIAVGDILRIACRFLMAGTDERVNVWHLRADSVLGGTDADKMADIAGFFDLAYTGLNSLFSDDLSYLDITGQNISKSELLPDQSWPTLTFGGDTNSAMPGPVSASVYWGTVAPKVVGRKFLPDTTEGTNADGTLTGNLIAALANFGGNFIVPIGLANIDVFAGTYNYAAQTFTPFLNVNVPVRFRTQRRRRRGVGS